MFLQTLNFAEISNHTFLLTWDCSGDMVNKSHSGRSRHTHAYSGILRHIQTYSSIIKYTQELFRDIQDTV